MNRLQGQIIWITGSGRRLGRDMAIGCAREGADVVVHCCLSLEDAQHVVADIQAMGRRALLVRGNVGEPADASRMVSEIEEEFGRLTALVNCAASYTSESFPEITERDFFSVIRSNLYGPFLCTQFALPLLENAKPGRVVNITDWAIHHPYRNYSHYMAAKGGLHTLTMALARELAPAVLVNEIAPGPCLPPEKQSEALTKKIAGRMLTKRWVDPEAIVRALLFLLEADDIVGETITVDGGRTLG